MRPPWWRAEFEGCAVLHACAAQGMAYAHDALAALHADYMRLLTENARLLERGAPAMTIHLNRQDPMTRPIADLVIKKRDT